MIKSVITWVMLTVMAMGGHGKEATELQMAGVLHAYPYLDSVPPAQTAAPEGYKAFHIEHYGRHGSRYLLSDQDYSVPVKNLEKAEKEGLLTPLGKKTLDFLRKSQKEARGRLGQLTPKGALQHQAIGRRMAQNFPEIFQPGASLTAKSTVVQRCKESMDNALTGITAVSPGLRFEKGSGEEYMWFMNYRDKPALALRDKVNKEVLDHYRDSVMGSLTFIGRLVTDEKFGAEKVMPGLLPRLFWVLSASQNLDGQPCLLEEVFGHEDLVKNWNYGNARRFLLGGNSAMTRGRMPYSQRNLLGRIIECADKAIDSGTPGANLRFGHDDVLMPLLVLMELRNFGREINSFEALETSGWNDYDITPMAGNLQLIFYRPEGEFSSDDVLVKALINEEEVAMPATPVTGPYYRWNDLKNLYLNKLISFTEKFGPDSR